MILKGYCKPHIFLFCNVTIIIMITTLYVTFRHLQFDVSILISETVLDNQTFKQDNATCSQFVNKQVKIDNDIFNTLTLKCCTNITSTTTSLNDNNGVFLDNCLEYLKREIRCKKDTRHHFLGTARPLVALASVQGSGNSWTRELLEYVTEIYTGSLYPDDTANFAGSDMCPTNGKVFIVKTHLTYDHVTKKECENTPFSKAIYLLRNPFDSMIADFNRLTSENMTGISTKHIFETTDWLKHVMTRANQLEKMSSYWLNVFDRPVYLLEYERLRSHTSTELFNILEFLDVPARIKSPLCLDEVQLNRYYRNIKPAWMRKEILFNNILRGIVNNSITSIITELEANEKAVNILKRYYLNT